MLKALIWEIHAMYRRVKIRMTSEFLLEIQQSKRQWNDIYKILKEKFVSPQNWEISFKIESEINTLLGKQKMREISR